MGIETKSMHVTPVGGNIFADLGFEPKEAARLLAETDRAISEKLAIKESNYEYRSLHLSGHMVARRRRARWLVR